MASTSHEQDKQGPTIAILVHEGMTISDAGPDIAEATQLMLEYDPRPPFDSGSLAKASPRAIELARGFIQDWVADSTAKYGQHA